MRIESGLPCLDCPEGFVQAGPALTLRNQSRQARLEVVAVSSIIAEMGCGVFFVFGVAGLLVFLARTNAECKCGPTLGPQGRQRALVLAPARAAPPHRARNPFHFSGRTFRFRTRGRAFLHGCPEGAKTNDDGRVTVGGSRQFSFSAAKFRQFLARPGGPSIHRN